MGNSQDKSAFRAHVVELAKRPVSASDPLWGKLLAFTGTADDIFAMLQLSDVRAVMKRHPRNVGLLVVKLVGQIKGIASSPKPDQMEALLTAVRVLTRVIPALLENPGGPDDMAHTLFWKNLLPPKRAPTPAATAAAATPAAADAGVESGDSAVGGGDATAAPATTAAAAGADSGSGAGGSDEAKPGTGTGDAGAAASATTSAESTDGPAGGQFAGTRVGAEGDPPLGRQLIHSIMALLFLPDFTVAQSQYTLWRAARRRAAESAKKAAAAKAEKDKEAAAAAAAAAAAPAAAAEAAAGGASAGASSATASTRADAPAPPTAAKQQQQQFVTATVEYMLLWNGGIGFPEHRAVTGSDLDARRVEVLRLLMTCLSGPLYRAQDPGSLIADNFLAEAVSPACPLAPTLFYSLLNSAIGYDPVGWGVPYGGALVRDEAEPLMNISVQVLCILLDYKAVNAAAARSAAAAAAAAASAPVDGSSAGAGDSGSAPAPPVVHNLYRGLLAGLSTQHDLHTLFVGMSRLLNNVHEADNTYLPFSLKKIGCYQEMLVLLWKALDENPRFLTHVLQSEDVCELVVPMVYYMWQGRAHASKVGLVNICTFNLLMLSGFRNMGVALNKRFTRKLPADLPLFEGSHADLLIIVLHKLIVAGHRNLATLHPWYLTIICNVSPYVKELSMVAAAKLVKLFEIFSSPAFLFAKADNHSYVAQLLETFNNLIQYQFEGATHLVYALVRRRAVLERLVLMKSPPPAAVQAADAAAEVTAAAAAEGVDAGEGEGGTPGASTSSDASAAGAGGGAADEAAAAGSAASATPHAPAPAVVPAATSTEKGKGASGNGGGAFVPTSEWLESWRSALPLGTVMRLVDVLGPRIEEFCETSPRAVDDASVVEFIKGTTMVGLLPVPHPIVMRKYQPNLYTNVWFATFLWGVIFLQNQEMPIFDSKAIRLFSVAVAP